MGWGHAWLEVSESFEARRKLPLLAPPPPPPTLTRGEAQTPGKLSPRGLACGSVKGAGEVPGPSGSQASEGSGHGQGWSAQGLPSRGQVPARAGYPGLLLCLEPCLS